MGVLVREGEGRVGKEEEEEEEEAREEGEERDMRVAVRVREST